MSPEPDSGALGRRGGRRLVLLLRSAAARRGGLATTPVGGALVAARLRLLDRQDHVALGDGVALGHLDLGDLAGMGRGNLHRRLVGFQLDQRVFLLDRVADRDQHGDHRHVGEIADIGNFHIRHRQDLTASGGGDPPAGRPTAPRSGPRARRRSPGGRRRATSAGSSAARTSRRPRSVSSSTW